MNPSTQYFEDLTRAFDKKKPTITVKPRNTYQRQRIYQMCVQFGYSVATVIDHSQHHHNFHLTEDADGFTVRRSKTPFVTMTLTLGCKESLRTNTRSETTCTYDSARYGRCGETTQETFLKRDGWTLEKIFQKYPENCSYPYDRMGFSIHL
jgi:hypothetical protein